MPEVKGGLSAAVKGLQFTKMSVSYSEKPQQELLDYRDYLTNSLKKSSKIK